MAVRCAGAASGADLPSGLLAIDFARSAINVAFFDELRRRGFIEGQNLTVEYRAYAQHVDLIPQYAAELVKARVDVIATTGEETVLAVQQATKTIPIVAIVCDMLGIRTSDLAGDESSSFHPTFLSVGSISSVRVANLGALRQFNRLDGVIGHA
jgi:hypothetical protein